MNNTLKSILIIGGTFIIGLILGGLIVGYIIKTHMDKDPEQHVKKIFHKGLDLTESQASQMDAVLLKYKPKREELIDAFEKQKDDLFDGITGEMKVFLEPDQMTKLNRRIKHMKEHSPFRKHRRKKGKRH